MDLIYVNSYNLIRVKLEDTEVKSLDIEDGNGSNVTTPQTFLESNSTLNTTLPENLNTPKNVDRNYMLYVYGGLVIGSVIMSTYRNILLYKICKRTSFNVHKMMLNCIMNAPMRFFDANPSGKWNTNCQHCHDYTNIY